MMKLSPPSVLTVQIGGTNWKFQFLNFKRQFKFWISKPSAFWADGQMARWFDAFQFKKQSCFQKSKEACSRYLVFDVAAIHRVHTFAGFLIRFLHAGVQWTVFSTRFAAFNLKNLLILQIELFDWIAVCDAGPLIAKFQVLDECWMVRVSWLRITFESFEWK